MAIAKKSASFNISDNLQKIKETTKEKKKEILPDSFETTICSVRLSMDERDELKSFFATNGVTLSRGLLLGAFYLEDQVKNGNIRLTRSGLFQNANA